MKVITIIVYLVHQQQNNSIIAVGVSVNSNTSSGASPNTSLAGQSGNHNRSDSRRGKQQYCSSNNSICSTRTSVPFNKSNDNRARCVRSFMSLHHQPNNNNSARSIRSYFPSSAEPVHLPSK